MPLLSNECTSPGFPGFVPNSLLDGTSPLHTNRAWRDWTECHPTDCNRHSFAPSQPRALPSTPSHPTHYSGIIVPVPKSIVKTGDLTFPLEEMRIHLSCSRNCDLPRGCFQAMEQMPDIVSVPVSPSVLPPKTHPPPPPYSTGNPICYIA